MGVQDEQRRTVKSVCKNCGTEIMHWVHYAAAGEIPYFPPSLDKVLPDYHINRRIFIHDGTIADVECDVIVLSCSQSVAPKGMKSVYDEAGPQLTKTAQKLGPKEYSDVVETEGFLLPCDHVFHVVMPPAVQSSQDTEQADTAGVGSLAQFLQILLEKALLNILNLMVEKGYKSIALPCLGPGAKSINLKEGCSDVGLRTIRHWMDTVVDGKPNYKRVVSIILCRYSEEDIIAYDKVLHRWFPTGSGPPQILEPQQPEETPSKGKKPTKGKKKK